MNTDWIVAHASTLQHRYAHLRAQTQQLPHPGSLPLTIAGRFVGWMTRPTAQHLHKAGDVYISAQAVAIIPPSHTLMSLHQTLARIAQTLYDAGCLYGWRGELLDVFAEGQAIAAIERAATRPLGLLTRAVHLNAWTPDGALWIAQRARTKATDPGRWDTLVGGLCAAGETVQTSLVRESAEEAGLSAQDLLSCTAAQKVMRIHKRLPEGFQVEDVIVSECVLDDSIKPKNIDGEVSCIRAIFPESLGSMIYADAFTIEAELVILHSLLSRIQQGTS